MTTTHTQHTQQNPGHTPGPWRDTEIIDKSGCTMFVDNHNLPVAVVKASIADTRIMAAAPELLAACKSAKLALESAGLSGTWAAGVWQRCNNAIQTAERTK